MARTKRRDAVKVSYNIDRKLLNLLKQFSRMTGRYETRVVEMALSEYFENHKSEMASDKSQE